MENYYYTKALSLYNQGDYEGALDVLRFSTVHSKEEDALKEECRNQIIRQYVYLIKDAISQSDYQEARKWKDEYITKYGYSEAVDSIEIPAIIISNPPEEKPSVEKEVLPEEKQMVEVEKAVSSENVDIEKEQQAVPLQRKSTGKNVLWIMLAIVVILGGIVGGKVVMDNMKKEKIEARLNEIKAKEGVRVITVLNNVVYYIEEGKLTYSKYNLETEQTEEQRIFVDDDISDISEAYYAENQNCIIFIGSTGSFYKIDLSRVYKLDLATNKLENILSGENIRYSVDYFVITNRELIVRGDYAAMDELFFYDEYYDYNGNLIDGKKIRGKGYIGRYPIEMSIHSLKGNITGWYKYNGHTNYMTLKGEIKDNGDFTFSEYNEMGERFGAFAGNSDFNRQKLSGVWINGETHLNFEIFGEENNGTNMNNEYQSELKDLIIYWNELHTNQLISSTSLECLYAPEVLFYGQTLSSKDCVTRIIQTMRKYDDFSQTLVGDIKYTIIGNNSIRCDFTKKVQTDGKYSDYPAYLIFGKDGNSWSIVTESDLQTDAYFERNK